MTIVITGLPGSGKTHFSNYFTKKTGIFVRDEDTDVHTTRAFTAMDIKRLNYSPTVWYHCSHMANHKQLFQVTKRVFRKGKYQHRSTEWFVLNTFTEPYFVPFDLPSILLISLKIAGHRIFGSPNS